MASRKIGTSGNPTSLLHKGVSNPEQLLGEDKQKLSYTPSGRCHYPSSIEIPDQSQQASPSGNL